MQFHNLLPAIYPHKLTTVNSYPTWWPIRILTFIHKIYQWIPCNTVSLQHLSCNKCLLATLTWCEKFSRKLRRWKVTSKRILRKKRLKKWFCNKLLLSLWHITWCKISFRLSKIRPNNPIKITLFFLPSQTRSKKKFLTIYSLTWVNNLKNTFKNPCQELWIKFHFIVTVSIVQTIQTVIHRF